MVLPSSIAKLVLGYLHNEGLEQSCRTFQGESTLLNEDQEHVLNPFSKSLKEIIDDYVQLRETVTLCNEESEINSILLSLWKKFDVVVGQLKYACKPVSSPKKNVRRAASIRRRPSYLARAVIPPMHCTCNQNKNRQQTALGNVPVTRLPLNQQSRRAPLYLINQQSEIQSGQAGFLTTVNVPVSASGAICMPVNPSLHMQADTHACSTTDITDKSLNFIRSASSNMRMSDDSSICSSSSVPRQVATSMFNDVVDSTLAPSFLHELASSHVLQKNDGSKSKNLTAVAPGISSVSTDPMSEVRPVQVIDEGHVPEPSHLADVPSGGHGFQDQGDSMWLDDAMDTGSQPLGNNNKDVNSLPAPVSQAILQLKSPKRKGNPPRKRTTLKTISPAKLPPQTENITIAMQPVISVNPTPSEVDWADIADVAMPYFLDTLLNTPLMQEKLAENINKVVSSTKSGLSVESSSESQSTSMSTVCTEKVETGPEAPDVPVDDILCMMESDPAFETLFSLFGTDAISALSPTKQPQTTSSVSMSGTNEPLCTVATSSVRTASPTASQTASSLTSAISTVTESLVLFANSPAKMPLPSSSTRRSYMYMPVKPTRLTPLKMTVETPPEITSSLYGYQGKHTAGTGGSAIPVSSSAAANIQPHVRSLDFFQGQVPDKVVKIQKSKTKLKQKRPRGKPRRNAQQQQEKGILVEHKGKPLSQKAKMHRSAKGNQSLRKEPKQLGNNKTRSSVLEKNDKHSNVGTTVVSSLDKASIGMSSGNASGQKKQENESTAVFCMGNQAQQVASASSFLQVLAGNHLNNKLLPSSVGGLNTKVPVDGVQNVSQGTTLLQHLQGAAILHQMQGPVQILQRALPQPVMSQTSAVSSTRLMPQGMNTLGIATGHHQGILQSDQVSRRSVSAPTGPQHTVSLQEVAFQNSLQSSMSHSSVASTKMSNLAETMVTLKRAHCSPMIPSQSLLQSLMVQPRGGQTRPFNEGVLPHKTCLSEHAVRPPQEHHSKEVQSLSQRCQGTSSKETVQTLLKGPVEQQTSHHSHITFSLAQPSAQELRDNVNEDLDFIQGSAHLGDNLGTTSNVNLSPASTISQSAEECVSGFIAGFNDFVSDKDVKDNSSQNQTNAYSENSQVDVTTVEGMETDPEGKGMYMMYTCDGKTEKSVSSSGQGRCSISFKSLPTEHYTVRLKGRVKENQHNLQSVKITGNSLQDQASSTAHNVPSISPVVMTSSPANDVTSDTSPASTCTVDSPGRSTPLDSSGEALSGSRVENSKRRATCSSDVADNMVKKTKTSKKSKKSKSKKKDRKMLPANFDVDRFLSKLHYVEN